MKKRGNQHFGAFGLTFAGIVRFLFLSLDQSIRCQVARRICVQFQILNLSVKRS